MSINYQSGKKVNLHQHRIKDARYTQSCKAQFGDDYRRIFVPKSVLVEHIIEGLVKSAWEHRSMPPKNNLSPALIISHYSFGLLQTIQRYRRCSSRMGPAVLHPCRIGSQAWTSPRAFV